jgi:tetratricopeptide (TPR) repeat protein
LASSSVMAYRLPIVDVGRELEGVNYVPRLFRNAPGIYFTGRIHEQAFGVIETLRQEWGLENKLGTARLLHHGYNAEVSKSRNKVERNLRLLEQALEESPSDANLLMNYGLELVRSGAVRPGISQYLSALEILSAPGAGEAPPELRENLLTQLCSHLLAVKDHAKLLEVLSASFATEPGLTASLHFLAGLTLLEQRQFAGAAGHFRQCILKRRKPAFAPIHKDTVGAAPNHCLAVCLAALDQPDQAEVAFKTALNDEPQSRPVRFDWARHLWKQGQPVEALRVLNQLVGEKPDDATAWRLGGEIALSQPDFLEFARDWTGEASKALPREAALQCQYAEALMLSGEFARALSIWRQFGEPTHRRHISALMLCELATGSQIRPVADEDEKAVSQEFLKWYRRLLGTALASVVADLNGRIEALEPVLPSAAEILRTALVAAEEPVAG